MIAIIPVRRQSVTLALPSGRFLLGAVPADAFFADQQLPMSQVSSRAGFRQSDRANVLAALQSGFMLPYTASSCSTGVVPASGGLQAANILSAAGRSALSLAPTTGPAAPFVAIGGAIAAVFGKIFGAIFGGHQAAVNREQATLCQSVPTVNQFLQQIDQAYSSGQLTPSQASQLVDQIQGQWDYMVSAIIKKTATSCNAACDIGRQLAAVIAKRKAIYADAQTQTTIAQTQTAGLLPQPGIPGTAAPAAAPGGALAPAASAATSRISSVIPWAAVALGLWLLLERS